MGNNREGTDESSQFKYRTIVNSLLRETKDNQDPIYDCEFIVENLDEIVLELMKFIIMPDTDDSKEITLYWDGSTATKEERKLLPGEKVSFEFKYVSRTRPPKFSVHVDIVKST